MTTTTIADFVTQHGITLRCEQTDHNPNMDGSDRMDHWKCRLHCQSRVMSVVFSKGSGHHGAEPTSDELLDCLASDAASVDNARSFEDWAGDFGYDTDSRKALRTYKTCEKQAAKLKALLGDEAYEQLLYHTERL
jgi:hypothetical protein